MPSPSRSVCAIVVTYQPDIAVVGQLLRDLESNACDFVVIDNHSRNGDELAAIVSHLTHARGMQRQPDNIGQAAALNLGLQQLQEWRYGLALLFDQDSAIGPDFCDRLLQAWDEAQAHAPGPVAAIGPRLEDPVSGHVTPFRSFERLFDTRERAIGPDGQLVQTDFLITSGCLLSLEAVAVVGPMRADYFIDNVDLEWCFRARARGYRIYGTDHVRLSHRIGETSDNYLVRKGVVVQHSALRFYYSSRNRLHLRRQSYAPRHWRLKDSVRFALKTTYLLLTSPQRGAYWASLRKAVSDARLLP